MDAASAEIVVKSYIGIVAEKWNTLIIAKMIITKQLIFNNNDSYLSCKL